MAIGPQERDALRKRVGEQYKQKDIPVLMVGLDLALRGFELSRRRLDNNALEWEQYVPLRGHYNATAAGILDAFEEQGLTPQAAMIWKKTHARFWTELEEPAYMTAYCTQLFQRMLPHIVAAHSSLRALANMLVSLKAKADDPKSVAVIRSSIESNTAGLNRAGFGIEVRALRSIHGFDSTTDYHWMEKYLPKLNGPVQAPAAQGVVSQVSSSIVRPRGLQKCAPSGGGPDDATPMVPEPLGEPWEEALGTPPGAVPPSKPATVVAQPSPATPVVRPRGLQKSSPGNDPFDISDDSFGM